MYNTDVRTDFDLEKEGGGARKSNPTPYICPLCEHHRHKPPEGMPL